VLKSKTTDSSAAGPKTSEQVSLSPDKIAEADDWAKQMGEAPINNERLALNKWFKVTHVVIPQPMCHSLKLEVW